MFGKAIVRGLLAAVLVSYTVVAQAVTIPSSAWAGAAPAVAGDGLNGSFWDTPGPGWSGNGWDPGTLAGADAFIASLPETARFTATFIDYPNGGAGPTSDPQSNWTMSQFVGSDASTISGDGTKPIEWSSTFRFQGYIKITSDLDVTPGGEIDVNFALGSDDGSRLRIGGVEIASKDGATSFGVSTGTASFSSAGLYPIDLVYYNSWGASGIELSSSIPSAHLGSGDVGIVPPSYLYTAMPVHEPVDLTWKNLGGGLFGEPTNWNSGTPGPADHAIFNLGSTAGYTVTFNNNPSNASLLVDGDRVTLDLASSPNHTYSLTSTAGYSLTVGGTATSPSFLTVQNGTLNTVNALISGAPGASAKMTLTGPNTLWTTSGEVAVGSVGDGVLTVNNGATFHPSRLDIGNNWQGSGEVIVEGTGSTLLNEDWVSLGTWTSHGALTVRDGGRFTCYGLAIGGWYSGYGQATFTGPGTTAEFAGINVGGADGATGSLIISDHAALSGGDISVGRFNGSVGTALITDHATVVASIAVGENGYGQMTISGGANLTHDNWASVRVGNSSGVGFLTVQDPGSTFTIINTYWGGLEVGLSGQGTLNILDGATLDNDQYFNSGNNSDGIGTIVVDGNGSLFRNRNSTSYVGIQGQAALTVRNGARFEVSTLSLARDDAGPGARGNGSVTVTGHGSTMVVADKITIGEAGDGTLVISNSASASVTSAHVAYSAGSTGTATVTGAGSTWTNSGELFVGDSGAGTLMIADGGKVSNGNGFLGHLSGSTGTATVTGAGSTWTNSGDDLWVGFSGTGTLTIENGGQVRNEFGIVGGESGSTGTATVTGAGSIWTSNRALEVGMYGTGTLTIENGGLVKGSELGIVGVASGSSGTATVTGADSTWNSGPLVVGLQSGSTGALRVENGGKVSNGYWGCIGADSGSTGTVTVTGAGSTWTTGGANLDVGNSGTGTLTIADGGKVSTGNGFLGHLSGSTGTATVTGAGSTWTNSEKLYVGDSGTGTLTIAEGGQVTASNVSINSQSTVNLRVNGSGMLVLGTASTTGSILNSGKINLYADAFLAAGTYSPITEYAGRAMTWSGAGTYNATGGTWNSTAETFTVAEATALAAGASDSVSTGEGLLITDLASGKRVGASFGTVVASTTFSASLMSGDDLSGLALVADGTMLSAWNFTTNFTGGEVLLSFDIGLGKSNLEIWHYSDGKWTPYTAGYMIYDDRGTVSFTVDGFSGYAVTAVPEPATFVLLGMGAIGLLGYSWRRRRRTAM